MNGKARRHLQRALSEGFGTKTGVEKKRNNGHIYVDLTGKEYSEILKIAIIYQPPLDVRQSIRNSGQPPLITRGGPTSDNGFRTGFRDRVMKILGGPESPVEISRDFYLQIKMGESYTSRSIVTFHIQHTNELLDDEKTKICTVLKEAFQMAVLIPSETDFECKYERPQSLSATSWFPMESPNEIQQGPSGHWSHVGY